jgi:hypothetical protein
MRELLPLTDADWAAELSGFSERGDGGIGYAAEPREPTRRTRAFFVAGGSFEHERDEI